MRQMVTYGSEGWKSPLPIRFQKQSNTGVVCPVTFDPMYNILPKMPSYELRTLTMFAVELPLGVVPIFVARVLCDGRGAAEPLNTMWKLSVCRAAAGPHQ